MLMRVYSSSGNGKVNGLFSVNKVLISLLVRVYVVVEKRMVGVTEEVEEFDGKWI